MPVRAPSARPVASVSPRARVVERAPAAASGAPASASVDATAPPLDAATSLSAMLSAAAGLKRSRAPEGREALLTPRELARARAALEECSPSRRERLFAALRSLDGVAAPFARGLVLRAIAARKDALAHGADTGALSVVERFASRMRGLDEATLSARASVLDLDSTRSSSDFAPIALWDKRGVTSDRGQHDDDTGNDGLFQRFTASCGPTTLQLMLAEADPALAFELHEQGLHSDDTQGPAALFQRALLEAYGGVSLGRREAHLRARLRNALGRVGAANLIGDSEKRALLRYALEQGPLDDEAARALRAVRARYQGFPDDTQLARLRSEIWPERDEGIGTDALRALLDEHVSPLVGARYRATGPEGGFSRGQAWRHLDDVTRALKAGYDVPFGICEPGHWMLISAVRGRKPSRELLVSDPDSGRTAWVGERAFVRGTFADETFGLAEHGQRPYVDCFLLPERGA